MVLNNFINRRFTTKNSSVNRSVSATADERVCMQIYVNTGLYSVYFCLAVRPSHELHVQSSDFYSVPGMGGEYCDERVCLSVCTVCMFTSLCMFIFYVGEMYNENHVDFYHYCPSLHTALHRDVS